MDDQEFDRRLPATNDRLFINKDWAYDAHMIGDPAERFYRLPHGQKEAGDAIVLQAAADPRQRANLIYPALFCYRKAIELQLKKLVGDYGHRVVFPPAPKKQRNLGHNLEFLWSKLEVVADSRGSVDVALFNAVRALVIEMHRADEVNDCFRYAADRADNPFAFGDRNIDLENLHSSMDALTNFFECTDYMFQGQDDRGYK